MTYRYPKLDSSDSTVNVDDSSEDTVISATALLPLLTKTVTLTSTQVKNLHGTPITLIAAQGAGTVISVLSAVGKLVYGGTTAFVASSAQQIEIYYSTLVSEIASAVVSNAGIKATSNNYNVGMVGNVSSTTANLENLDVVAYNSSLTEISGDVLNDSTVVIELVYSILEI